jgi:hypothetical protein
MTIVDLKEVRQARQQAAWDEWLADMDRRLAEIKGVADRLTPIVERWIAEEKPRPRGRRCEAPGCHNTLTTLHPVPGRTSADDSALIRLCVRHAGAVRNGRIRVSVDGEETLLWQLYDDPGAPPSFQLRLPRRRRSRRRSW